MLTLKGKQKLAAKLLNVELEDIVADGEELEQFDALYYALPDGGGAIIVGADGNVLYANSSVSFAMHSLDYKKGKRTPLESFNIAEKIDDKIVTDITRLKKGSQFVMEDYLKKYGVKTVKEMTRVDKVVREKLMHLGIKLELKGTGTHQYSTPTIKK